MSASNEFSKYKALVFDCYGTLIDWETGIYEGLKPLFSKAGKPSDRRTVIDAFSSVEHDLQGRFPSMLYPDILARVHTTLDARLQNKETPPSALRDDASAGAPVVSSAHTSTGTSPSASAQVGTSAAGAGAHEVAPGAAVAFAQSVAAWQPFPDTVPALATLSKHFKLAILSNIDRATIAKTRRVLEGDPAAPAFTFDAVYTAEEVDAYKPAPEMLAHALAHLEADFGIAQGEVLMTAQSMMHDIIPARGRGIDTAWINRADAVTGLKDVKGDEAKYVFPTLGALADAVEGRGA
ncbi:haloalkanoic acid dehalogenase [Trametes maxima]|nr:haloalkanoic acid dehalogenase [Trametes maxima]